ncbi:14298_t:CDS:2, partial [Cetraspora pellucida]
HFDKTSNTDHSNKNNNPNRSNKKPGNKPKLQKNPSWPTITEMFYHVAEQNTCQKESINYALVEWIVTDLQPLYVLKNESFIKLIHTLNLYYELLSDKYVKALIHQSYNYLIKNLKMLLATEIKICRLTCNLWTAHSKSGYIGVTCYFINSNYKLKEAILAIKYAPYSYDAVNIKAELEEIINDWGLFEKVISITTDNAANMIKAINLMSIDQVSCTAHTLQLAIGKGLKPAEVLIKCAKRLINFLSTLKQNEQLRKAQELLKISKKNIDNNEQEFYYAISNTPTQ